MLIIYYYYNKLYIFPKKFPINFFQRIFFKNNPSINQKWETPVIVNTTVQMSVSLVQTKSNWIMVSKKIVKDIAEIQILEEEIIASFLLRVNFDKSQYGGITSNKKQKFIFKFNDRDNLREPELVKHIPRTSQAGTKEKRS